MLTHMIKTKTKLTEIQGDPKCQGLVPANSSSVILTVKVPIDVNVTSRNNNRQKTFVNFKHLLVKTQTSRGKG